MYLTVLASGLAVMAAYYTFRTRNRIDLALTTLMGVYAVRGVLLYLYFNASSQTAQALVRAPDFVVSALILPLGLIMAKTYLPPSTGWSQRGGEIVVYGMAIIVATLAVPLTLFFGVRAARAVLIPTVIVSVSIVSVLYARVMFRSSHKRRRPEVTRGFRFIAAGYAFFFVGEAIGGGLLGLVDIGLAAVATGALFVYSGVAIVRTVTFASLYESLDTLFIVASDEETVESTNLGGLVEDGHWRTDGVNKAREILNLFRAEVREVMATGERKTILEASLDVIDPERPFRVDIVPHDWTPDGRCCNVLLMLTDATSLMREKDREQLRNALFRVSKERLNALRLADLLQHDVSNMVQEIILAVELAGSVIDDRGALEGALEMILESTRRIEYLINRVKILRKTQTSQLEQVTLEVRDLINRAVTTAKSLSQDPGVRVGVRYPQEELAVIADPMIEHALADVFRICMTHIAPENDRLNIDVSPIDDGTRVKVEVTTFSSLLGPESLPSLLDWYSPGVQPGESLSLPLAKIIIERSGGTIQIQERVPGTPEGGIKFIVTLPSGELSEVDKSHRENIPFGGAT